MNIIFKWTKFTNQWLIGLFQAEYWSKEGDLPWWHKKQFEIKMEWWVQFNIEEFKYFDQSPAVSTTIKPQ